MLKVLCIILVIAAVFAIAAFMESRRERSLREWMAKKPNMKLHWPFDIEDHPSVPAAELTHRFIQRPPLAWASGVQIIDEGGDVWCIEFRTTPLGKESSCWFTLIARKADLQTKSASFATPFDEGSKSLNGWNCHLRKGLITVPLLDDICHSTSL